MLEQLGTAYRRLIEHEQPAEDEDQRLLSVIDYMRWYADRISLERWGKMPRSNIWSFEQNLWHLNKQAQGGIAAISTRPIRYYIDRGKECVGLAAEILALFENSKPE